MREVLKYFLLGGLVIFIASSLLAQQNATKKHLCRGVWELTSLSFDYTTCIAFDLPDEILSGGLEDEDCVPQLKFDATTDSVKNLITGLTEPFYFKTVGSSQYLTIGKETFWLVWINRKECLIAPYSFQKSIGGVGYFFKRKKTSLWKRIFGK